MDPRWDTGFWMAVAVSVFLHTGGVYMYYRFAQSPYDTALKVESVTAAVLVRKGKPRPKELLPRIFKDKPKTTPKKRIVRRKKKPKRRKRRRRANDDDLIRRAQQRIEEMRRRSRREEDDPRAEYGAKPGQADGHVGGTAQTARLGNVYLGKLRNKIEGNMEFPEILSKEQILSCRKRIQVMMYLNKKGHLRRGLLRVVRSGGDRRCDNAVQAAIKRSSPFPSPPDKLWGQVKRGIIIQLAQ